MAPRRKTKPTKAKVGASRGRAKVESETSPRFPYTTKPGSLRRLLKEIPKKPRPPKFDMDMLRSWGFSDANDHSMLRVLKAVNLLDSKNEPTDLYSQFMSIDGGAKVLGPEVRRVYEPMFQASHTPYSESNEKLQNLFNIHSGGGERSLDLQIQTFKALCENAQFDGGPTQDAPALSANGPIVDSRVDPTNSQGPAVNINLHIHLPENKTRRDYTDIIEDIGRYIFGRSVGDRRD